MPAGQVIFHEGDRGAVMYVILEGSASIVVADQVVEIAGPGGIVGELALVDDDVRSAPPASPCPRAG